MRKQPLFVLLCGPNGAGKTTFYTLYLSQLRLPFINADQIAAECWPNEDLSAERVYDAAREASRRRDAHITDGKSFISETVFSHPSKIELLRRAKAAGFRTRLIYVHLNSETLAIKRVQQRVNKGGHPVPSDKIRARYHRLRQHLQVATHVVDEVYIYDNSGSGKAGRNHVFAGKVSRGRLVEKTKDWPIDLDTIFSKDGED